MANKGYKEKDLGWRKFKKDAKRIETQVESGEGLEVGFFAGNESLVKAVSAELGVPANVPARPFISATLDNGRKIYTAMLVDSMRAALVGGSGRDRMGRFKSPTVDIEDLLFEIGKEMRKDMIAYISAWSSPPNAPSTVERKGFNDPLVESGDMQDDIEIRIDL